MASTADGRETCVEFTTLVETELLAKIENKIGIGRINAVNVDYAGAIRCRAARLFRVWVSLRSGDLHQQIIPSALRRLAEMDYLEDYQPQQFESASSRYANVIGFASLPRATARYD